MPGSLLPRSDWSVLFFYRRVEGEPLGPVPFPLLLFRSMARKLSQRGSRKSDIPGRGSSRVCFPFQPSIPRTAYLRCHGNRATPRRQPMTASVFAVSDPADAARAVWAGRVRREWGKPRGPTRLRWTALLCNLRVLLSLNYHWCENDLTEIRGIRLERLTTVIRK